MERQAFSPYRFDENNPLSIVDIKPIAYWLEKNSVLNSLFQEQELLVTMVGIVLHPEERQQAFDTLELEWINHHMPSSWGFYDTIQHQWTIVERELEKLRKVTEDYLRGVFGYSSCESFSGHFLAPYLTHSKYSVAIGKSQNLLTHIGERLYE